MAKKKAKKAKTEERVWPSTPWGEQQRQKAEAAQKPNTPDAEESDTKAE